MKSIIPSFVLFTLSSLFSLIPGNLLMAQDNHDIWSVNRQKQFQKSYTVGSATVVLENSFGRMRLHTWNQDMVKLDATITVSTQDDAFAQEILQKIDIQEERNPNEISFKTQAGQNGRKWVTNKPYKITVDYDVYLPAKAAVKAINTYGLLEVGDVNNPSIELISRYGTLTGGKLTQLKSVTVEYGKATIAELGSSDITFRGSGISINAVTGNLKGLIDMCTSIDMPIMNSAKEISLNSRYTRLYFILDKNPDLQYDIETTNAIASGKQGLPLQEKQEASIASTDKMKVIKTKSYYYSGQFGTGNKTKLEVKSQGGSIRVL